ncbi:MAG: segregation and condensation protein A [Bacillota bacterium]
MSQHNNQDKYKVQLENFEGPLDLLLHLIEKNEIDIYDIPIAKITEQYIDHIYSADNFDIDSTSEFLVMAATLLSIKAKMLLPKPAKEIEGEEGEDPREELVLRLLEYKQYKEAANILRMKEHEMCKIFTRSVDVVEIQKKFGHVNPVENVTVNDLFAAFRVILERIKQIEPIYEIAKEEISIQDCMDAILSELAHNKNGLEFSDLFFPGISRLRIVMNFLAVLELIKINKITFRQKGQFGRIILFLKNDNI